MDLLAGGSVKGGAGGGQNGGEWIATSDFDAVLARCNTVDDDGDGVLNEFDQCPNTPPEAEVDSNGCAEPQLDDDGDGVTNDQDLCPDTQVGEPVDGHGCATSQLDEDSDGVLDANDQCPNSNLSVTIYIQDCPTNVTNSVQTNGCSIEDDIDEGANTAGDHGDFAGCVAKLTNQFKKNGIISGREKAAIQSCAAQSDIP